MLKNIVVNFDTDGKFSSATKCEYGTVTEGVEEATPNEPISLEELKQLVSVAE